MYMCGMAESLHCSSETITVCINWLYPNTREGNGNLLQYFCLENSIDRRGWRDTVRGVTNFLIFTMSPSAEKESDFDSENFPSSRILTFMRQQQPGHGF